MSSNENMQTLENQEVKEVTETTGAANVAEAVDTAAVVDPIDTDITVKATGFDDTKEDVDATEDSNTIETLETTAEATIDTDEDNDIDRMVEEIARKKEAQKQSKLEEEQESDEDAPLDEITINNMRWELARKLAAEYSFPIIPLSAFDDDYEMGKNAGKRALIKEWNKRTITTLQELDKWENDNRYSNIGLVLGGSIGVVAIDVDGQEGNEILLTLSKGDIPATVTFTTPGGGMRYLYKPREEMKNMVFKKFSKPGIAKHTECALLGDGQYTVLPYSIHSNLGVYMFEKGRSFDEIEIATMPMWMEELMLKNSHETLDHFQAISTPSNKSGKSNNQPQDDEEVSNADTEITLDDIFSQCPKLQELLETQKTMGLDEETWFRTISLLVNCGHVEMARNFSALSNKHDARSEKRISQLAMSNIGATTRCITLGCTEDKVKECFDTPNINKAGEITNSPSKLIRLKKMLDERIGFYYNKYGMGVNGVKFARYILKNYDIATKDGTALYTYIDNCWHMITTHKLKKVLRNFFNSIKEDKWTSDFEAIYWNNLMLDCPDVDNMESGTNYINVQNGLFNIDTFTLEPHNKDIFSTVQMPIEYNPKAECPQFIKYLTDVFENDMDLIKNIQEIMGYILIRNTKAQKIFIFLGDGSNGKSVLCLLLVALCGKENVSSVSMRNLSGRFSKAGLVDKNVNISTENELMGEKINTEDIKAISAGDPVQIERKHENSYTTNLFTKLIFAANRLPYLKDNTYALMRRLCIIPFNRTFVDNPTKEGQGKNDKELVEKLMGELAGILNFALEGLQRLQKNNYEFTMSQKSLVLLEEYRLEINPYLDFVQAAIMPTNGKSTKKLDNKKLYSAFVEWCNETNHSQLNKTTTRRFMKEIRSALKGLNMDFTEKPSNSTNQFEGIMLTDHYEDLVKRAVRTTAAKN